MEHLRRAPRRVACLLLPCRLPESHEEQLLSALGAHSPFVESDALAETSSFYLDARGLERLYRYEAHWCETVLEEVQRTVPVQARLGLAGSKFVAWVAAQTISSGSSYQVITGQDPLFLAPLPVDWLPLPAEARCRLRLLGLRTMAQFAALRETEVVEQFGPESRLAYRWAKGWDDRPVLGRRRQVVEAHYEFEVPESRREALLEAACWLANRAMRSLPAPHAAWSIRWVELEAAIAGQVLRRSAWLGQAPGPQNMRALLKNLIHTLAGAGPGISELGVRLLGLEPGGGQQLDLFAHSETRVRLEQTLQQLAKKYLPGCVVQAGLRDAEAPLVAERYLIREYRL